MEKPKRSFVTYLVSLDIFIVYSLLTRGLRLESAEYFKQNNEPYYLINLLIFLSLVMTIVLIVNLVRYNKVAFIISSIIIMLNVLYQLLGIIVVSTEPHSISVLITRIIFNVLNILMVFYLFNKKTLKRCDDFKQYYKENRVTKEALKLLKRR